jgi:hypothetical protein
VSANDITITNIVDKRRLPSARASSKDLSASATQASNLRRLGASRSVQLIFSTAAVMETLGYSDSSVMVANLQGDITTTYEHPAIGTTFVDTSIRMGSMTITNVTTVAFEAPVFIGEPVLSVASASPSTSPTQSVESDSKKENWFGSVGKSGGVKLTWFGLSIVLNVILLLLLLAYWIHKRKSSSATGGDIPISVRGPDSSSPAVFKKDEDIVDTTTAGDVELKKFSAPPTPPG